MKKQYDTPEAKKVEFNYEENVVASMNYKWNSEAPQDKSSSAKCWPPADPCKLVPAE